MFSGGLRLRRNAQTRRGAVFMWTALFVMSIGLQYMVASGPQPVIAASGLLAGTVAGFEVDGDLASGNGASNPGGVPAGLTSGLANGQDWLDANGVQGLVDPANPPTSFIARDAVDSASVTGDVSPDTTAYVGGNKEFDTRDWGYFNSAGPNDKTDYRHVMAGVKVSGGSPYVFLGAERISTNGSMVVDFELNQKPFKTWADGVAKPDRTVNDLLISLEYSNGGSNPIVTLYRVSSIVSQNANGQVVAFTQLSDQATINAVRSATNFVDLAGVAFPSATYTVPAFAWAEASVDLAALNLPVTCLNFGQGSIRSRTGGAIDSSQLKDATSEFPLSVNTCSRIMIEKVDAAGNHLGGATFSVSPNPLVGAPASPPLSITDNDANDGDARDGYILLTPCRPAETFTVTETSAPVGYIKDPAPQSKTTVASDTVTFTFTNGLGSIRWEKNGPNGTSLLGGATFTITPDPTDWTGTLTVADDGPNDADKTPGEFLVTGVRVDRAGGYTIAETVPPTGYIGSAATANANPTSADPDVSVAAGTWVNTLGSLRWVKNGPGGTSLLGGATFTITPSPLTGTGTLVVADNDANDADKDSGEFEVLGARTGTYSVQETTAPTGYIIDPDAANITVSAADRNPQIAAGTFVNTLGELVWTKDKDDQAKTPLGGATFSVTPNPYGAGSLTVVDNDARDLNKADGAFRLGDVPVGTYTVTETAAPEGYTRSTATCTITVSAANPSGTPACSFSNPPIPPVIDVVKTAGSSQASQVGDGLTFEVESFADNVVYKYVVTNTGPVRLVNVTLTDDKGTPANTADDVVVCTIASLAVEASETCYLTASITADTTNIVTAAGASAGEGLPATATDDAVVDIVGPAITIVKTAGASQASQSAQGATYETEAFAGNVVYKYVVTNTGTVALSNVSLGDDKLGTISCPKVALAVGESMTCYATATVGVDTTNIGTASGTSPANVTKTATDDAKVVILTPAISVVKTAGDAADGATYYTNGGNVLYTYVVANIGEVNLTDVTVVDDRGTASTADDVTVAVCVKGGQAQTAPFALAVGETMTCSATIAVNVDTTNIATASGKTPHATVTDTDNAVVLVRRVAILKDNNAAAPKNVGEVVAYTLTLSVQNGPIATMTIKDVLPANFGTPSAISDGGTYDAASRTITWNLANVANGKKLTYNVTIGATTAAGQYVNVATITVGPCVAGDCDDDSTVQVTKPAPAKLIVAKWFDVDGNLATTTDRFQASGWTFTTAITGGTISAASGTTGADGKVAFDVEVAGNGATALVDVTETLPNPKEFKLLTASCAMGEAARGTLSALTVGGVAVKQGETVTCTFLNTTGDVAPATATPRITPPPTTTESNPAGDASSNVLLVLLAIVGLVAVLGVLTPAPARARRRSRRG